MMLENALLSVIVPVYNVKNYILECVESILRQKYGNFECILVDDGSTDGSGEICDDLVNKDSRIQVIHKINGGLSSARNIGVEKSKGEYICFVDSDDVISEEYLKTLYENAVYFNADVSQCRYVSFSDGEKINPNFKNVFHKNSKEELLERITHIGTNDGISLVISCNKLIRRDIAVKISFPIGKLHEDEFYINYLMEEAESFVETPAELYYYRQRSDSISGNDNFGDVRHFDAVKAFRERLKLYKKICSEETYHKMKKSYRDFAVFVCKRFVRSKISIGK